MKKVIDVFGSFGFGNIGDEIIPSCIGRAIESTGRFVTVRPFTRYNNIILENVIEHREYLKSDLNRPLFISGGGVIENREMSCLNRAMAKKGLNSSEAIPFAISVEPGIRFGWRSRMSLRYKLKSFDCIYVRDKISSDVLKQLAPGASQKLVGDLGLWCTAENFNNTIQNMPEDYIVFIPSDNWNSEDFYNWIARELIKVAQHFEMPILIVPISYLAGEDIAISKTILSTIYSLNEKVVVDFLGDHYLKSPLNGEALAYVLAQSALTISMRLHGCVISYAQKTPFVALAYHPKLLGFVRTIDWDFAIMPRMLPGLQSENTYGYRFEDLSFSPGDLLDKSIEVMKKQNYSLLAHYKEVQSKEISKILEFS